MINDCELDDSLLDELESFSIHTLFDLLSKNCINYHPDKCFFSKIREKLSEVDESDQGTVIRNILKEIIAATKNHAPMTQREFMYCVDAEVQKFLRQEQENMGMFGLSGYILQEYEEYDDGTMKVTNTYPIIYDTDGNMATYTSQKHIDRNRKSGISRLYFTEVVCDDENATLLLYRILHENVFPKMSSKTLHTKYTWGHLYHTLYGLGLIIFCKQDIEKARALHSVFKNKVSLDTIHGRIKNMVFPKGKYMEWEIQNVDRSICETMAEWFEPVTNCINSHEFLNYVP